MPYNQDFPDYYVDGSCRLIGKAADGSYDLGNVQELSPSECAAALANWSDFVANYGEKFGIKQSGTGGPGNGQATGSGKGIFGFGNGGGSGFLSTKGGLFNFIGLGLIGEGGSGGDSPGFNIVDALIIAGIVIVVLLFLRRK